MVIKLLVSHAGRKMSEVGGKIKTGVRGPNVD